MSCSHVLHSSGESGILLIFFSGSGHHVSRKTVDKCCCCRCCCCCLFSHNRSRAFVSSLTPWRVQTPLALAARAHRSNLQKCRPIFLTPEEYEKDALVVMGAMSEDGELHFPTASAAESGLLQQQQPRYCDHHQKIADSSPPEELESKNEEERGGDRSEPDSDSDDEAEEMESAPAGPVPKNHEEGMELVTNKVGRRGDKKEAAEGERREKNEEEEGKDERKEEGLPVLAPKEKATGLLEPSEHRESKVVKAATPGVLEESGRAGREEASAAAPPEERPTVPGAAETQVSHLLMLIFFDRGRGCSSPQ